MPVFRRCKPPTSSVVPPPSSLPFNRLPPPSYQDIAPVASTTFDGAEYAFLGHSETVVLVDDSTSMKKSDSWNEVKNMLGAILRKVMQYDDNGVEIYFLNHRSQNQDAPDGRAPGGYYNIRDEGQISAITRNLVPEGLTPTSTRLYDIQCAYNTRVRTKPKPMNVIVLTNRAALDGATQKLVNIQLFSYTCEPGAEEALQKLNWGPVDQNTDI